MRAYSQFVSITHGRTGLAFLTCLMMFAFFGFAPISVACLDTLMKAERPLDALRLPFIIFLESCTESSLDSSPPTSCSLGKRQRTYLRLAFSVNSVLVEGFSSLVAPSISRVTKVSLISLPNLYVCRGRPAFFSFCIQWPKSSASRLLSKSNCKQNRYQLG